MPRRTLRRAHYSEASQSTQEKSAKNPEKMRLPEFPMSGSRMGSGFQGRGLLGFSEFGKPLIKLGDGADPTEIILERQMLIGSMGIFVRQTKSHQHARDFEGVVHLGNKGDGAAFPNEHGLFSEALLKGFQSGLEDRMRVGRGPGLSLAQDLKFAGDCLGEQMPDVFFHKLGDLVGVLVGHKARRKLRTSFRRNDGLGAIPRISTPDSVEFQGRAGPQTLDNREALFSEISRR